MINKNLMDTIKEVSDEDGIILLKSHLKLNKCDRKAIEFIELLPEGYSISEGIEIFQTAICWLGIFNSSVTASKEIEE